MVVLQYNSYTFFDILVILSFLVLSHIHLNILVAHLIYFDVLYCRHSKSYKNCALYLPLCDVFAWVTKECVHQSSYNTLKAPLQFIHPILFLNVFIYLTILLCIRLYVIKPLALLCLLFIISFPGLIFIFVFIEIAFFVLVILISEWLLDFFIIPTLQYPYFVN